VASLKTRKKVVASPRIPGPNSRFLSLKGEKETVRYDGEEVLVHIEPRPEHERVVKRQKVHPVTGEKIWKDAPKGMMPKPAMELVEVVPLYDKDAPGAFEDPENPGQWINPAGWREYVIDVGGNGTNSKNFYFRPDPALAARLKLEAERQARLNKLLDRLADADLDPDDLGAALDLASAAPAPKKKPAA
jgi:hypothetical protein